MRSRNDDLGGFTQSDLEQALWAHWRRHENSPAATSAAGSSDTEHTRRRVRWTFWAFVRWPRLHHDAPR